MDHQEEFELKSRAKAKARNEALERDAAFSDVIRLRTDLADASIRLASTKVNLRPRQSTAHVDHLLRCVDDLRTKLAAAEDYCRQVDPDRLQRHDETAAKVGETERQIARDQESERERELAANRERNRVAALERSQAKARRQAEEAELLARFQGVA